MVSTQSRVLVLLPNPPFNGRGSNSLQIHKHSSSATPTPFRLRNSGASRFTDRTKGLAFRALANSNGSTRNERSSKQIVMVDPLEAKRLAAEQMQEIRAREKLKRRRRIEAINGAWAMIGLTAGLVVEGHTGKSILDQLAFYWSSIVNYFVQ